MIGNNIQKLREYLGYTQTDFAAKIEYSQKHLSQVENNIKKPSPRMISAICQQFNANRDYLRTGIEPMLRMVYSRGPAEHGEKLPDVGETSYAESCNADITYKIICDAIKGLPSEDRDAFLMLAKILKFGEEGTKSAIKQNLKEFVKLVPAPVEPPPPEPRKPTQAENDFKLIGAQGQGVKTS